MSYEDLLIEADTEGIIVKEKPLLVEDGRCKGKKIAIRQDIPTLAKKADVLAEELGHYYTTVGNIIDLQEMKNMKQERAARIWAYNKRVGLYGIVNAFKQHCNSIFEVAEFLDVSEDTLIDALECYRQIYGTRTVLDNYIIKFEPYLLVCSCEIP